MKKRTWLLCFLIVLAAMNVIGADRLRLGATTPGRSSDPVETHTDEQVITSEKNGVPPEKVAAVIAAELQLFSIPNYLILICMMPVSTISSSQSHRRNYSSQTTSPMPSVRKNEKVSDSFFLQ